MSIRLHGNSTTCTSIEKVFTHFNCLYLTGVDESQRPQLIAIPDFRPHILLHHHQDMSVDTLMDILNNEFVTKEDEEPFIVQVKFEARTPFYGFTNGRKDPLCRIYICNLASQSTVINKLKAKYTLYHTDLSPALMFLHETGLRYGDWIHLPADQGLPHKHFMKMEHIRKMTENTPSISRILKCFIRHTCISQHVFTEGHSLYVEPNANTPHDRVISVSMDFAWIDMKSNEHLEHIIFTLLPPLDPENPLYKYCLTEEELLQKVKDKIQEYAPEDIIECNDNGSTLLYLFQRAQHFKTNPIADLEILGKVKLYKGGYQLKTRNLLNIAYFIKRKPFIPVEMYTLYEFATMSKIVKQPRSWNDMPWETHLVNQWWNQGPEGWLKIQQRLLFEAELMRQIEYDLQMRVELHEIQKTNFTDFSDTANRGEQIRASNAIWYFVHYHNYYLNKERLLTTPLHVKLIDYPPSYPAVTSIPLNEDYRKRKNQEFQHLLPPTKKKQKVKSQLEEDACQGGNVVVPTPGYYVHQVLAVLDFQSLYPNIIRFANISHDKLVYDKEYNDIPGLQYSTIPVNSEYGIRFAKGTEGIIAMVETQSLAKRKEAKKMMENETDKFLYNVYDQRQQSLKILCNAIYGALGASKGKYFLALRPLMTAVTSVGRFLQTKSSDYLATRYGLITVYGDTDSIMCIMNTFPEITNMKDKLDAMRQHYAMPENFAESVPKFDDPEVYTRSALFVVMAKLCKEIDDMFGKPIVLEPENIALRMMLTDLKKHYWYQCVEAKNPAKVSQRVVIMSYIMNR